MEVPFDPSQRPFVRKILYQGTPATSDELLYTSPNLPGARTEVAQIVVTNTSSSTATVRLHLVKKGGTSATTNAVLYDLSCSAKGTTVYQDIRLVLEEGDMLRGLNGTSGAVCLTISGLQESRVGGMQ